MTDFFAPTYTYEEKVSCFVTAHYYTWCAFILENLLKFSLVYLFVNLPINIIHNLKRFAT